MTAEWWKLEEGKEREEARKESNRTNRHLLRRKLFLFDQDGTLYLDFKPLPQSREFLAALKERHVQTSFITNNSSRSASVYQERLRDVLDVEASQREIYTSTKATIGWLRSEGMTRAYLVGTPGFMEEMEDAGIEHTAEEPQIIVLAFDTTLTYKKLEEMCYLIQKGVGYVATHPDKVCPTLDGYIPDIGAFIELVRTATGAGPQRILGKPNPDMVRFLLEEFDAKKEDAIIFGDRLYTDIRMGVDSGIATVLMLTGESRIEDIEKYGVAPDLVFKDLGEALELL
ncbi:MAG: HAD-IIA family hydrolase [Thermoplasmata archaeon]|nr:HAD-IIA family hydrolase [Thermoplasmata archaeon]